MWCRCDPSDAHGVPWLGHACCTWHTTGEKEKGKKQKVRTGSMRPASASADRSRQNWSSAGLSSFFLPCARTLPVNGRVTNARCAAVAHTAPVVHVCEYRPLGLSTHSLQYMVAVD